MLSARRRQGFPTGGWVLPSTGKMFRQTGHAVRSFRVGQESLGVAERDVALRFAAHHFGQFFDAFLFIERIDGL